MKTKIEFDCLFTIEEVFKLNVSEILKKSLKLQINFDLINNDVGKFFSDFINFPCCFFFQLFLLK